MFCTHCGSPLTEGAKFCAACGAPISVAQPQPTREPTPTPPPAPAPLPAGTPTPTNVLVWGILGLTFACTMVFSLLGIIFSCVARGKARKYTESGALYSTQVKVGRNLAKGGLIAGIILSVFFVLYILILVLVVMAATAGI